VESLCKNVVAGDTENVRLLLVAGINPNLKNKDGHAPLHCAAEAGVTNAIPVLLRGGASIDGRDFIDFTPLMVAARTASYNVVEVLLANGADINLTTAGGQTALMFAALGRSRPPADAGHFSRTAERSAEENALDSKYYMIVKLFLQNGANVNRRTRGGFTALSFAEVGGQTEIIDALKAAGARK
jgi:ankyrin repeat protein